MMVSVEQIKLLRLVQREGRVTPGAETEVGVQGPAFDRLLAIIVARKLIVADGEGWQLTGDGRAVVEMADMLAGKAGQA